MYAPLYDNQGNEVAERKCPFCRILAPTSEKEIVKRYRKRMELSDCNAIFDLGCFYRDGWHGFTQDNDKAFEYYHRAAELGCSEAVTNVAVAYHYGRNVERDGKKARQYWEIDRVCKYLYPLIIDTRTC